MMPGESTPTNSPQQTDVTSAQITFSVTEESKNSAQVDSAAKMSTGRGKRSFRLEIATYVSPPTPRQTANSPMPTNSLHSPPTPSAAVANTDIH